MFLFKVENADEGLEKLKGAEGKNSGSTFFVMAIATVINS